MPAHGEWLRPVFKCSRRRVAQAAASGANVIRHPFVSSWVITTRAEIWARCSGCPRVGVCWGLGGRPPPAYFGWDFVHVRAGTTARRFPSPCNVFSQKTPRRGAVNAQSSLHPSTTLRSCSQANRRRRLPLYDLLRTDYGDEDPLRAQERDEEDSFWRQVLFCV